MAEVPTFELRQLVREASTLLGSEACRGGVHAWRDIGGRPCPRDVDNCSQAVSECTTCGYVDHGEPGTPGAAHCATCSRQPEPDQAGWPTIK